jgi:hypothetical protein
MQDEEKGRVDLESCGRRKIESFGDGNSDFAPALTWGPAQWHFVLAGSGEGKSQIFCEVEGWNPFRDGRR